MKNLDNLYFAITEDGTEIRFDDMNLILAIACLKQQTRIIAELYQELDATRAIHNHQT
jgi:hypothetical protein